MKNRFKVMVIFLLFQVSVFADTASEIKDVNNKVLQIEKIKQGLNVLELKLQTGEMEAVPPQVKFYYKAENLELVLTQISVGHEVFSINYSYYFDKNKIIKYIKHIVGRADSPPKQAIIYGKDEKKLWENISQPVFDAKEMLNVFNANMKSIKSFSKY